MSEDERLKYKEACDVAIEYLWSLYQPYYEKNMMLTELRPILEYDKDQKMYLDLMSAMTCLRGKMRGNEFYQYDSFYLTTLRWRAEGFARKAFGGGEYGTTAYRLYKAAKIIDFNKWQPSNEVFELLQRIIDMAETEPKPVLFQFENLDAGLLYTEHGMPYTPDLYDAINNVRYTGKIDLNINNAEWL